MLQRMPWVYALLLLVETIGLGAIYATSFPPASSAIGLFLGWGALGSMVLMLVYSVARRSKRLRERARLSYWLHFHIFLGIQGFVWAVFHSLPVLRRGHLALLNPGLLAFSACAVVFFSGVFGRWLYGRLPMGADGIPIKTQRLFATWILLHRPLAAAMYVLLAMHVTLSFMFSAGLAR